MQNGGVLRFVQDYDRIVQCPPAHKRQRNDFDNVIDHEAADLLIVHHVMEGVEQRAEVRVDLGLHVSGQEAELFARFHGRTNQNQAPRPSVLKHIHGDRHGEIGFSRPGRAGTEDKVVVLHRLDVSLLPGGFGVDDLPAYVHVQHVGRLAFGLGGSADRLHDGSGGYRLVPPERPLEFFDHGRRMRDALGRSGQLDLPAAREYLHAERLADHLQVPVRRAEQLASLLGTVQCNAQFHGLFT